MIANHVIAITVNFGNRNDSDLFLAGWYAQCRCDSETQTSDHTDRVSEIGHIDQRKSMGNVRIMIPLVQFNSIQKANGRVQ
jgi:hypothetical protein